MKITLRSLYKDLAKVTGKKKRTTFSKRTMYFGKESTLIDCTDTFGGGIMNSIITDNAGSAITFLKKLKECFLKNIDSFEKRIEKLTPITNNFGGLIGAMISLPKAGNCNNLYDTTKKELIEKIKEIDSKISKLEGKSPSMGDDIYDKVTGSKIYEIPGKLPSLFPDEKCLKNTQILKTRTVTILKMLDERISALEI